jgi:septum formation protein
MLKNKLHLILASASPRRKELLGHLKIPFEIIALSVPEESAQKDPRLFSQDIARLKSQAVLEKLQGERFGEDQFVVSADTIVYLEGRIFEKPRDVNEAREFLKILSGKTHSVFTAVSLQLRKRSDIFNHQFVEESKVTFSQISDTLLEHYLETGDSLDKAGAYGIQGASLSFISKVDGDYANVVGFPLSRFVKEAEAFLKSHYPEEASWFNLF